VAAEHFLVIDERRRGRFKMRGLSGGGGGGGNLNLGINKINFIFIRTLSRFYGDVELPPPPALAPYLFILFRDYEIINSQKDPLFLPHKRIISNGVRAS
jgi:hypothetical protein